MLSAVIDKLTSWTSPYFLIATFFPVLVFVFLHSLMLAQVLPEFHTIFRSVLVNVDAATKSFTWAAVIIGIAILAYVYASASGFLREVLEGSHLPNWLAHALTKKHHHRRRILLDQRGSAINNRAELERKGDHWKDLLGQARIAGYPSLPFRRASISSADALARLADKWSGGAEIDAEELRRAVVVLIAELMLNSAEGPTPCHHQLGIDYQRLLDIIDYATQQQTYLHTRSQTQIEFRYPDGPLRPTTMGNIAATMAAYAESRYGIDLDTFWTRMQRTIQDDAKLNSTLQDAKAQLDFMVALVWLSASFTACWVLILPFVSQNSLLLGLVGVEGALAVRLAYALACNSYESFAAQVRSAVDLQRIAFLKAMQIPAPSDILEERRRWKILGRVLKFGEKADIPYMAPK